MMVLMEADYLRISLAVVAADQAVKVVAEAVQVVILLCLSQILLSMILLQVTVERVLP